MWFGETKLAPTTLEATKIIKNKIFANFFTFILYTLFQFFPNVLMMFFVLCHIFLGLK